MTHLIFYREISLAQPRVDLESPLAALLSDPGLIVLHSLVDLKRRLETPSPFGECEIYILAANTRMDLMKLLDLEKRLVDKRLILAIPDRDRETVTLAHRLRPRFVFCMQENPKVLLAVTEKMIHNANSNPHGRSLDKTTRKVWNA